MTEVANLEAGRGQGVKARWLKLRESQPAIRARDAAEALGVSEAELLAARCGEGVRRLAGPWGALIEGLPKLGPVMALTRNEHVVHEKVGRYEEVSIFKNMGLVLGPDIDLRVFLRHWHFGFAVSEEGRSGLRHSLQVFDRDGTAVHKVYLREESDREAYDALVAAHLHADQSPEIAVEAREPAAEPRPDGEIDVAALRQAWEALKDVHEFHGLLNKLGCGRTQAFRLVGPDLAYRVEPGSFRVALEAAAENGMPIMIFAGSAGVIQIHTGPVRKLMEMGSWFNVLDPGFNLHLRSDRIASAWIIRKPTRDGIVTSLEVFDEEDAQIALMFGQRKPGETERQDWRDLVEGLARLEAEA